MEASPAARPVTELIRANLRRWANESLGLRLFQKKKKFCQRVFPRSKETTGLIPKESTRTKSEWVTQFQKKASKKKATFFRTTLKIYPPLERIHIPPTGEKENRIFKHCLGIQDLFLAGYRFCGLSTQIPMQKLRCQVAKMIQAFCYHTKGMLQWFQAFRQISQIWTQWQSWRRSWLPGSWTTAGSGTPGHMGRQEVTVPPHFARLHDTAQ